MKVERILKGVIVSFFSTIILYLVLLSLSSLLLIAAFFSQPYNLLVLLLLYLSSFLTYLSLPPSNQMADSRTVYENQLPVDTPPE
ncbi:MAG: hypothetical protein ACFFD4_20345 [Candidatus Odinarchaeota archaeon]